MADPKPKTVKLTALRNIPISMCADAKDIPARLKKHAGGARVEKGTEITVTEDVAKTLKDAGYAK